MRGYAPIPRWTTSARLVRTPALLRAWEPPSKLGSHVHTKSHFAPHLRAYADIFKYFWGPASNFGTFIAQFEVLGSV